MGEGCRETMVGGGSNLWEGSGNNRDGRCAYAYAESEQGGLNETW